MNTVISVSIAVLTIIAIIGFIVYVRNLLKHEEKEFYLLPWVIFSYLAFLDCLNIILSEGVTWIESLGGIVMFLGPVCVSSIIIGKSWKLNTSKENPISILRKELEDSIPQATILGIGVTLMAILTITEIFTSYGELEVIEYSLAGATILLDVVAMSAISYEIDEEPEKFEMSSWSLWLIAAIGVYACNGIQFDEWSSVGAILILENAVVSIWVILLIHLKRT